MNTRNNQRGDMVIAACALMLLAIFSVLLGLAMWLDYTACHNRADMMRLESRWGPVTGCMVRVDDRWSPLE